jgi:hypothetical protein
MTQKMKKVNPCLPDYVSMLDAKHMPEEDSSI